MTLPREVALKLLQATSLPDESMFLDRTVPLNTVVDYYRIACHVLFVCERCGTCCNTGDPIRLSQDDIERIARRLKIPLGKAVKKYTMPDPDRPGVLDFKKILPCKFYDPVMRRCKIYDARPWSCRIFPFIGIYGSEDQVKIHESCAGSVKAVKMLTEAVDELRTDPTFSPFFDMEMVKRAKQWFKDVLDTVK
ncbi:Putative zinc- or iron-chelating domain protein [uncultured archaeon]|nr:Putative zinc- or iron-chelating domain protein [uncultured archaeon]